MDRQLYKIPFSDGNFPDWVCPTCQKGVLELKKGTFTKDSSAMSKRDQDHPAWDPDWLSFVYSCFLICSNKSCKEAVSSCGTGFVDLYVELNEHGVPDQEWGSFYTPSFFQPHLVFFNITENTPQNVVDEIHRSFSLFFCDPPSSSNHIRISLEHLLTHLKVSKTVTTKDDKIRILNLHARIEKMPREYKNLKDLLLAMKWLGNAGSHAEKTITVDDVMDSYEIMEVVLNEIFEKKMARAKKIAKKINKKKGP